MSPPTISQHAEREATSPAAAACSAGRGGRRAARRRAHRPRTPPRPARTPPRRCGTPGGTSARWSPGSSSRTWPRRRSAPSASTGSGGPARTAAPRAAGPWPCGTGCAGCSSDGRISFRLISTAPKDAALTRKAAGVPTALMTRPATAGPTILARLNTALFSAIAFGMPSRPTISTANALPGRVVHDGDQAERERQRVDLPDPHRAGERQHAEDQGEAAHGRLGGHQDAALGVPVGDHPAPQAEAACGRNCRPVVMPSAVPLLWVSSSTSQSWATRCIQLPVLETTWPVANSR